jgi:hypothetical protein
LNLGVTFETTGVIVQWAVPSTGAYTIVAIGAQGAFTAGSVGGYGASMQGVFYLVENQILSILVGQQPSSPTTRM